MKKFIFSALSLIIAVFMLVSCDDTFDDLVTANVKTGGMINPTSTVPYKLGSTPQVDVDLTIPVGPGIQSVEVYRTYTGKTEVLDQTIDVGAANAAGEITKTVSFTYAQLASGLGLPADENDLEIGDKWTIRYVSIMEDGRSVDVPSKTVIAVANFFAGPYVKDMSYYHPSAGTYPTDPYSRYTENADLVALNASECEDWFGAWEDTKMIIHIYADNSILLTFVDRPDVNQGDPNNAANVCSYDPVTGVIKLYYNYSGAGGFRIFWAVYTPR